MGKIEAKLPIFLMIAYSYEQPPINGLPPSF
jgi:hypothetical protein